MYGAPSVGSLAAQVAEDRLKMAELYVKTCADRCSRADRNGRENFRMLKPRDASGLDQFAIPADRWTAGPHSCASLKRFAV
jgi:hypothetical protein